METVEATGRSTAESRRVVGWRFDELCRAGYGQREALELADRPDVDLHLAVELMRRGCSTETALRILR